MRRVFGRWIPGLLTLAAGVLAGLPGHGKPAGLPTAIERYETLFLRSPGPGTAFDRVYQHFSKQGGAEALEARWQTASRNTNEASARAAFEQGLGLLAERRGLEQAALEHYREAARHAPESYRPWVRLGRLALAQGRFEDAARAIGEALVREPPVFDRQELQLSLARAYQRSGRAEQALALWRELVAANPQDATLATEAGEAFMTAGDYAGAREVFSRLADGNSADAFTAVRARARLAQVAEMEGDIDAAFEILHACLEQTDPQGWLHRDLRTRLETLYLAHGRLDELAARYEAGIERKGRALEAALGLARIARQAHDYAEEARWRKAAAEWAPSRHAYKLALAQAQARAGHEEAALQTLRAYLRHEPVDPAAHRLLGTIHWERHRRTGEAGAREDAIAAWRRLSEVTGGVRGQLEFARLLRSHNLTGRALEAYRQVLDAGGEPAGAVLELAGYLYELGQSTGAADLISARLAEGPELAETTRLLRELLRQRSLDALEPALAEALGRFPGAFSLHEMRLRLAEARGQAGLFHDTYAASLEAGLDPADLQEIERRYVSGLILLAEAEALFSEFMTRLVAETGREPDPPADPEARERQRAWLAKGGLQEREFRLLLRLAAQRGQDEVLEMLLGEATRRYPDSPALARLALELYREREMPERELAELERLRRLQPENRREWLRKRIEIRAGMGDATALEDVQELLRLAPADTASLLFAAETAASLNRTGLAERYLREARRLSDSPVEAVLRLAALLREQGRGEELRSLLLEAFFSSEELEAKRALLQPMLEYYRSRGEGEALVHLLRARRSLSPERRDHHLLMASALERLGRYGEARAEVLQALEFAEENPALLRQLLSLARAEGDFVDEMRYARALAERNPGGNEQREYAFALLANGLWEEAAAILQRQPGLLADEPAEWKSVMAELRDLRREKAFFELMESAFATREPSPERLLSLAEAAVFAGQQAGARELLWELVRFDEGAHGHPDGLFARSSIQRFRDASSAAQELQLLQLGAFLSHQKRMPALRTLGGSVPRGRDARLRAVGYLATLAQNRGEREAFHGRLDQALAGQELPPRERVLIWALAGDGGRFYAEAEAVHQDGELEPGLASFLRNVAQQLTANGIHPPDGSAVAQLIPSAENAAAGLSLRDRIQAMLNQGRLAEAAELVESESEKIFEQDPGDLPLRFTAIKALVLNREFGRATPRIDQLLDAVRAHPDTSRFEYLLLELSRILVLAAADDGGVSPAEAGLFARVTLHLYPDRLEEDFDLAAACAVKLADDPARYINPVFPTRLQGRQLIQLIGQQEQVMKLVDGVGIYAEALGEAAAGRGDGRALFPHLARATLLWQNGQRSKALEALAAIEAASHELLLLEAVMNWKANRAQQAQSLLAELPGDPALGTNAALMREYFIVRIGKGAPVERLREAALRLARTPRTLQLRNLNLAEALKTFGAAEAALVWERRDSAAGGYSPDQEATFRQLRELSRDGAGAAAELARTLLNRSGGRERAQLAHQRRQALRILLEAGQGLDYLRERHAQLEAIPGALEPLRAVAELYAVAEEERRTQRVRLEPRPQERTLRFRRAGESLLLEEKGPEGWVRLKRYAFPWSGPLLAGLYAEAPTSEAAALPVERVVLRDAAGNVLARLDPAGAGSLETANPAALGEQPSGFTPAPSRRGQKLAHGESGLMLRAPEDDRVRPDSRYTDPEAWALATAPGDFTLEMTWDASASKRFAAAGMMVRRTHGRDAPHVALELRGDDFYEEQRVFPGLEYLNVLRELYERVPGDGEIRRAYADALRQAGDEETLLALHLEDFEQFGLLALARDRQMQQDFIRNEALGRLAAETATLTLEPEVQARQEIYAEMLMRMLGRIGTSLTATGHTAEGLRLRWYGLEIGVLRRSPQVMNDALSLLGEPAVWNDPSALRRLVGLVFFDPRGGDAGNPVREEASGIQPWLLFSGNNDGRPAAWPFLEKLRGHPVAWQFFTRGLAERAGGTGERAGDYRLLEAMVALLREEPGRADRWLALRSENEAGSRRDRGSLFVYFHFPFAVRTLHAQGGLAFEQLDQLYQAASRALEASPRSRHYVVPFKLHHVVAALEADRLELARRLARDVEQYFWEDALRSNGNFNTQTFVELVRVLYALEEWDLCWKLIELEDASSMLVRDQSFREIKQAVALHRAGQQENARPE